MSSVLKSNLLNFNCDTLTDVRQEFNLNEPGSMTQSIHILHDWIQKQEHFTKKDFDFRVDFYYRQGTIDKEYLERFIISAKGSVEKAKTRISKLCTMRTMAPNLFESCRVKDLPKLRDFFLQVMVPELTEDNYRILCSKMFPTKITSAAYLEAFQHCVIICEYLKLHDYAKGYYLIVDLNDINIKDLVINLNLIDFRNILTLIIEGYGIRIRGVHILSSSKIINTLVKIVKQFVSTKISQRINVFKNVESLHTILPKHLLPEDFVGEQKSILELFDEQNEELSSDSHILHMKKMKQACTDKIIQRSDKFNEEYLGMPRSLEMLSID